MLNTFYKIVGVGGMVGGMWIAFAFHLYTVGTTISDDREIIIALAFLTPPAVELYRLYHEIATVGLVSGWIESLLLVLLIYMIGNASIQRWQYREDHGLG